jgi:hypothetical protein
MSLTHPERAVVLWAGAAARPEHRREHEQRGLLLREVDPSGVAAATLDYRFARGLVICAMPPGLPAAKKALSYIVSALDHGLQILVLVGDSVVHAFVLGCIEKDVPSGPARERIRYRLGATPHEVAEVFARHLPGPAVAPALAIDAPEIGLTGQQRFLLQRAFSDCSAIRLTKLTGGRSALTLSVQATLSNSFAGPHPLPFFAKLDQAALIAAEQLCYERYADSHIAWYLRPNLQPGRCLIGSDAGILVGSFVPASESLWMLIVQGRARAAIQSLFTETLAGWRTEHAANRSEQGSIPPSLVGVFNPINVRKRYVKAAAELGFSFEPQAIWESLLNLPVRAWRKAPIHGDLHADNVRVRGSDAIIIDLAKATLGPLGADPACLEVWIAFQSPPAGYDIAAHRWRRTVEELFSYPFAGASDRDDSASEAGWLWAGVVQTRRVALMGNARADYAVILALYLLRRATFEPDAVDPVGDGYRRSGPGSWAAAC